MPDFDPFYRRLRRLSGDNPQRMLTEASAMWLLLAVGAIVLSILGQLGSIRLPLLDAIGFLIAGTLAGYLAARGIIRGRRFRDDS